MNNLDSPFSSLPIESQNRILMNDNRSLYRKLKELDGENGGLLIEIHRLEKRIVGANHKELNHLKDIIEIQNRRIIRQENFIEHLKGKVK